MSQERVPQGLLREMGAMLTQARYLHLDLKTVHRSGRGPHVVLVHGLYASAGVFRPMRSVLEERLAIGSSSFSYVPGPGIVELAQRLQALISGISEDKPIIIVGHSLGGLVARHYVTSELCDSRVAHTITLSSPYFGSDKSSLVPGQAGRDIAPDAPGLAALRADSSQNCRLPHLSIVAAEDQMIRLPAFPGFGERALVVGVGHNGILFDKKAIELVFSRIYRLTSSQQAGAAP